MDYVKQYRKLDAAIEASDKKLELDKWEVAHLAHDAIESGKHTRRSFAGAVGKSARTISTQVQIWANYGEVKPAARPRYVDAFNEVTGDHRPFGNAGGTAKQQQHDIEVAKRVMSDPKTARVLMNDRDFKVNVGKATLEQHKATLDGQRSRSPEVHAAGVRSDAMLAGLRAINALRSCVRAIEDEPITARLANDLAFIAERAQLYIDFIESASRTKGTLHDEIEKSLATHAEEAP